MYEVLDILCLLVLGGWAYLTAKKRRRDEVGWAIVAAAAFYLVGMVMEKALAPRLGLTPGGQKASAYLAGGLAAVIVNLVLWLKPPLAPSEREKGGQAPGAGAGGTGPGEAGPAAPSGQPPAAQQMAAAAPATARTPWTFLARFWPVCLIVLMYLPTQSEAVIQWLVRHHYEPPYPPYREMALVPLIAAQTWILRRRVAEVVLAALFVAMFVPALNWMEWHWWRGSDYYSHGYIIPLVVGALIWRVRGPLSSLEPKGDFRRFGLAVLLGGLLLLLAGTFLRAYSVQGVSLVAVLCGLVFYLCGRAISRLVAFPLLFTLTMVPLPMHTIDGLSFRLKMFASAASVRLVDVLGSIGLHSYIVVQKGSYLLWEKRDGQLDQIVMGDVCSGLRSLIALIAFGALFAYVAKLSLARRLILFAAAVPISLLANMWRVVTLTFIACHFGSEATHGWVHDFTGYGIFAVAFVLFFAFERFLRLFEPKREGAAPLAATT